MQAYIYFYIDYLLKILNTYTELKKSNNTFLVVILDEIMDGYKWYQI